MKFCQWLHPHEHRKVFTERDIDYLAQFIQPGDTAVDIGSFTGDTALPMAVAAGQTGYVYAFEPNPESLRVLIDNSILNPQFALICVIPYAIGLAREKRVFRYHCEQINGGFLTGGDPITVKNIRLDEGVIENKVSFVKFDCEGEDGVLLDAFIPWLKGNGNPVVQVERYPHLTDAQQFILWKAITAYGIPSLKDDWSFTELTKLPETLVDIVIRPRGPDGCSHF
jgi:FkbM family methyltransferase